MLVVFSSNFSSLKNHVSCILLLSYKQSWLNKNILFITGNLAPGEMGNGIALGRNPYEIVIIHLFTSWVYTEEAILKHKNQLKTILKIKLMRHISDFTFSTYLKS